MKKGKSLSTPKDEFLFLVQETNKYLVESMRLSEEDALIKWNQEISPYGYPNYQKSVLSKAMIVWDFNTCQMHEAFKGLLPDVEEDDGTVTSFSNLALSIAKELEGSNYYITDSLANSLFNTDTPDDFSFIKEALSLNILPQINIIFSNNFKLSRSYWCDHIHSIAIRQVENQGVDVYLYLDKELGHISFTFRIPLTKNDCCQLCETQKFFDKNHLGAYNYSVNMSKYLNPSDSSNEKNTYKFIEEKKKDQENLVNILRKDSIPDVYAFVINLLCLMTQQPDIISVEKSASKYVATTNKGFASQKMNNVPNVHWLGADFTTRVQYSKKINTDLSEISRGKPKRSHWRRGHWHTISQGPGRLQKKLRWFQPVFIKGHKEEVHE